MRSPDAYTIEVAYALDPAQPGDLFEIRVEKFSGEELVIVEQFPDALAARACGLQVGGPMSRVTVCAAGTPS